MENANLANCPVRHYGRCLYAFGVTTISSPSFGYESIATGSALGETFTVPIDGDNVLTDFTYYAVGGGAATTFNIAIYAFEENNLAVNGAPLFVSAPLTAPFTYNFPPFPAESLDVSNIPLAPGASYIAIIEQGGYGNTGNVQMSESGYADGYAGGEIESYTGPSNTPPFTATFEPGGLIPQADLAFSATFIPEPTAALLACGCLPLLLRRRQNH